MSENLFHFGQLIHLHATKVVTDALSTLVDCWLAGKTKVWY
jgi:hypothetical protein